MDKYTKKVKRKNPNVNMEPVPKKARLLDQYYKDGGGERRENISKVSNTGPSLSDSDSEEEFGRPSFGGSLNSNAGFAANSLYDGNSATEPLTDRLPTKSAQGFVVSDTTKNEGIYSDTAGKLMAKMGYKKGTGLGVRSQGRVDIVESSMQKGRRGLGTSIKGFEPSQVDWNFGKEEVTVDEQGDWIPSCKESVPDREEMETWITMGVKKMRIDDEFEFCSETTVTDVCNCKSIFDNLEGEEMRRARTKSNPYETIRGVFFLNRAAMKMANMDAVFDFMFTDPKDEKGNPLVTGNSLLYFADICAGPGGFSEYILWRKKWDAKGFGFTLKGACDFKLEDFYAAPSELFEPFYGVGGLDGDGDIYRPDNLIAFKEFVMNSTNQCGLHFVMADGGFSVEGQENLQEILSKRLYLCQFLCALMTLRSGGHFVCKLFDLFTSFSVGLVYLMYRAFHSISIFKPVTSRPANSERYIVCSGKRSDSQPVIDYMFDINQMLEKQTGILNDEDIVEVVPLSILKSDTAFYDYIYDSNEKIGKNQCISLVKIQTFAKNSNLYEHRQSDIREQCLQKWNIPDQVRTAPTRSEPAFKRFSSLTETNEEYLHEASKLENDNLELKMKSIYDYRVFLSGSEQRWMLLGLGKTYVYKWDGNQASKWRKLDDVHVELPRDTVLEVELVQELRGESKGQRRVTGVHVIDGMFLCGTDIRKLHYNERVEKLRKFVKAIDRPTRPDLAPVRVKDIYRCEDITHIFNRLEMKIVKGSGNRQRLCYCTQPTPDTQNTVNRYFLPTGICFVKTVKDPWMMAFSKSNKRKYFFHTQQKSSIFETPPDSIADFMSCQQSRLLWAWEEGVGVHPDQPEDKRKLSKNTLLSYINKHR